jgi:hypothetical protein
MNHAQVICVQGACAPGTCDPGFADCDHQPGNGCEQDVLSSATHCGACAHPCVAENSTFTCNQGACSVASCDPPWQDCDESAANGCEADIQTDPMHCGACKQACKQGELCYQGQCAANAEVLAWLATQKAGWCLDDYQKLVNLCGKVSVCHYELCGDLDQDPPGSETCYDDYQHEHEKAVPFCCDTRFLKAYPDGLAIDVGFHYDGLSIGGVLDLGGDVDYKRLNLRFTEPSRLVASAGSAPLLETTVTKGTFLVSFHVSSEFAALYVNGLLADQDAGSPTLLELATDHGPGMVMGARMAYWWEPGPKLRFAPFLMHLRGRAPSDPWSLQHAVEPGNDTLLLFRGEGIHSNEWNAVIGPQKAYAITTATVGLPPMWMTDVSQQCF